MKSWFNRKSYYYKYLFSYLILLIIPIIAIGFYVDAKLIKTLEQEVLVNEVNTLYQVKDSFDSDMLQMDKITSDIFLKTFNLTYNLKDNPLRIVDLIDEMNNFVLTTPIIEEMFFYYLGDDFVVSSSGSVPIHLFYESYFVYDSWDAEGFKETVKNLKEPLVVPPDTIRSLDNNSYEAMTYFYPIRRTFGKEYGVIFFSVPSEVVEDKVKSIINTNNKITIVADEQNQIITTSTGNNDIVNDALNAFLKKDIAQDLVFIQEEITINDENYFAVKIQSDETNWKFITLTPEVSISSKVNELKFGFIIGLLVVGLIGLVFIFLTMRVTYNPIKKLKSYSESISDDTMQGSGELEVIRRSIDFLSSQNTKLTDAIAMSGKASRQLLIMELLRGVQPKDKALYEMADRYNIELDKACTVVTIHINTDSELSLARNEIITQAREVLEESVSVYECQQMDYKKITLLITLDALDYATVVNSLQQLQVELREDSCLSIAIGLSNLQTSIDFAPKAFLEASTAIDYRLVKGNDHVISYGEIVVKEGSLSAYPKTNLQKIKTYLDAGDISAIEIELDNIVHYIKTQNTPIFVVRGLMFDLINLIYQSSQKMLVEFDDLQIDLPDAFTLSDYDTVDDLANVVTNLSRDLCSRIIKQKDEEELGLLHDMVAYIMENYQDTDFSLAGMADYFGMYQSSLSSYFKEKTDQTILNYVTRIKMKKATELLESTSKNLNEIALVVGYNNTNSFIRRFKQWHNITPGEYRKQHKG